MTFSERLKKLIVGLNVKKKDFVRKCGVSTTQYFNYQRGDQEPSTKFFRTIKKHYPSINLNWLINGEGSMFISASQGELKKTPPVERPTEPSGHTGAIQREAEREMFLIDKDDKPDVGKIVTKTIEIVESDTIYSIALKHNINAFYNSLIAERVHRKREQTLEDRLAALEQKIQDMQNQAEQEKEAEKKSA